MNLTKLILIFILNFISSKSNLTKIINLQDDIDLYNNPKLNCSDYILKTFSNTSNNNLIENSNYNITNKIEIISYEEHNEIENNITINNIKKVKLNGISESDLFSFKIINSENLITNDNQPLIIKSENKTKNKVNIKLIKSQIKFNFTSQNFQINLTKFVIINEYIIGIDINTNLLKIYQYEYDKNSKNLLKINLKEFPDLYNLNKTKIKNILIDSKNKQNLYIVDYDENIHFYNIEITNFIIKFKKHFSYKNPIVNLYKIIKIFRKWNTFFIGFKNGGILLLTSDRKSKYILSYNNNNEIQLEDLEMIENSIYILIKNFGIKILDISHSYSFDLEQIKFSSFEFYHPYIKSFNHFNKSSENNNFTNYLGCLTNLDNFKNKEFYFEFNLQNEFQPTFSNIFLWNKNIDLKFIYNYNNFIYFFETNSNNLFLLKNEELFRFNINLIMNREIVNQNGFVINNEILGFFTKDNFVFTNFAGIIKSKLILDFNSEGEFIFQFDNLEIIYHIQNLNLSKRKLIEYYSKFVVIFYILFVLLILINLRNFRNFKKNENTKISDSNKYVKSGVEDLSSTERSTNTDNTDNSNNIDNIDV